MRKKFDYSKEDIIKALKKVGIKKGDSLFIHSNIGFFGCLKDVERPDDYYKIFKDSIFKVIGEDGTLIVPTFSYSFCWNQVYDNEKTPSRCGFFSEMIRLDKDSLRSDDANFSIAAIGKNSKFFTEGVPENSFGNNSSWDRFLNKNGKFCNFNFDAASTFIHYVEKQLNVPYRFDKEFCGAFVCDNKTEKRKFYHFCYDLNKKEHAPDFSKFDAKAKSVGYAKVANLGRGQIVLISAKDTFDLITKEYKKNPAFLIGSL